MPACAATAWSIAKRHARDAVDQAHPRHQACTSFCSSCIRSSRVRVLICRRGREELPPPARRRNRAGRSGATWRTSTARGMAGTPWTGRTARRASRSACGDLANGLGASLCQLLELLVAGEAGRALIGGDLRVQAASCACGSRSCWCSARRRHECDRDRSKPIARSWDRRRDAALCRSAARRRGSGCPHAATSSTSAGDGQRRRDFAKPAVVPQEPGRLERQAQLSRAARRTRESHGRTVRTPRSTPAARCMEWKARIADPRPICCIPSLKMCRASRTISSSLMSSTPSAIRHA